MDIKVLASGSKGNAYWISDGKTTLLLDAGISIKDIQTRCDFKLRQVFGCLVSHSHADHSKAVMDVAKFGIDVYASQGTIDACKLVGHRIQPVKALQAVDINTWSVLAFDVQHDAPEPLGFLCASKATGERLLYFTDTYYIKYKFPDLTHIMAECNYDSESLRYSVDAGYVPIELVPRLMKSHMSLDHLIEMLKANDLSKVKQIYLLHLSGNNSNPEHMRETVARQTGAEVYVC